MRLAKVIGYVVGGGLTLISLATPSTAQTFSGNSSGTWGEPDPGAESNPYFSGVGTNVFRWGTPSDANTDSSQLTFIGSSFSTDISSQFEIGDLTYFNGSNVSGTTVEAVPLDISLSLTSPLGLSETFAFNFDLINTTGDPNPPDTIRFENARSQSSFTFEGTEYTLELLGFSQDEGATILEEFPNIYENGTATANLYGRITPVPEPASVLGVLAFGALGAGSRLKRRQQQVIKDNSLN